MKFDADVLVIGGGASGIPAAIGAARAGARVALVEEDPIAGGAITDCYVAMLCGGPRTGVIAEMERRLNGRHRLPSGPRWFLPSSWTAVIGEMLAGEKDLRLLFGTRARFPIVEDAAGRPRVAGAIVRGPEVGGRQIRAAVTIDATGSGQMASAAGCRVLYGRDAKADFGEPHAVEVADDRVQECTWMYVSQKMRGGPAFDMMRLENVRRGVLDAGLGWFHNKPEEAMRRDAGIYLHWGCAVRCRDTRDPVSVADAQREALADMERDLALLREDGYAIHLAPRIGVRECRRVVGEHVITENDLRSGKLPADTIALGDYGLDLWGEKLSQDECRTPAYGIPYRALVPKDVDGLLLAGKVLSGTHVAMGAYRVMPIVGAAGQAAGVAAALCAREGIQPRNLDPNRIREVLGSRPQNVKLEP